VPKDVPEKTTDIESYQSKLTRVEFADALAGQKKYKESLAIINDIKTTDSEKLLRGICFQATGEYFARSGYFSEALLHLEQAESFFPTNDQTVDAGILFKWLGYVHAKLKNSRPAQSYLYCRKYSEKAGFANRSIS